MIKYILVGGYVPNAKDEGRAFCEELVKDIDKKPVKILDCLFARPINIWEEKIKEDNIFFSKYIKDFEVELADPNNFTEQVKQSDVIYLRGGDTTLLMNLLSKNTGWDKGLHDKVLVGTSAGAEAIARYYYDYVLEIPRVREGLNFLPIKFISHFGSHYFDGREQNIDWHKAMKDLSEYKENELPVRALAEGEFIVINSVEV